MKTYYYNLEDAEFIYPSGDRCNVVPELFYQDKAIWRIVLRDRKDRPVDISGVSAWGAAVDNNYCSGNVPMCRTLAEGIIADVESGAVEVTIDAATPEFLAAVNGTAMKPAFFELYGLDADGERVLSLCFEIRARMILDPDPTIPGEVPEAIATKVYASAVARGAADSLSSSLHETLTAVSGGLQQQLDAASEDLARRPTSSGASTIARNIVSGALVNYQSSVVKVTDTTATSAFIPVLSGGTQYRYTQELTTLSVGSVADAPVEDEIVFSAGAVVTPPASVAVIASAWRDIQNGAEGSATGWDETPLSQTCVTLTSAGGWSAETSVCSEFWTGEDDVVLSCTMSAALVSSGGGYVISCRGDNVLGRNDYDFDTGTEIFEVLVSSSYSGIFASSPDMGNWTVVNSDCMIWGVAFVEWERWIEDDQEFNSMDDRALRFTSFGIAGSAEVVPCEISLPPTVRFLNSGALMPVSSGGVYVMNFKDNVLAMGEVKEREAAE